MKCVLSRFSLYIIELLLKAQQNHHWHKKKKHSCFFISWHVIDLFIEFLLISPQKNGDIPDVYLADLVYNKEFMSFSNNDLSHFWGGGMNPWWGKSIWARMCIETTHLHANLMKTPSRKSLKPVSEDIVKQQTTCTHMEYVREMS